MDLRPFCGMVIPSLVQTFGDFDCAASRTPGRLAAACQAPGSVARPGRVKRCQKPDARRHLGWKVKPTFVTVYERFMNIYEYFTGSKT